MTPLHLPYEHRSPAATFRPWKKTPCWLVTFQCVKLPALVMQGRRIKTRGTRRTPTLFRLLILDQP
jgi:hypothetical protein